MKNSIWILVAAFVLNACLSGEFSHKGKTYYHFTEANYYDFQKYFEGPNFKAMIGMRRLAGPYSYSWVFNKKSFQAAVDHVLENCQRNAEKNIADPCHLEFVGMVDVSGKSPEEIDKIAIEPQMSLQTYLSDHSIRPSVTVIICHLSSELKIFARENACLSMGGTVQSKLKPPLKPN